MHQLTRKYAEVFQPEFGTIRRFKAHPQLKEGARSQFFHPRPVPFALKESIEKDLARLEQNGSLIRVEYSDRASPIIPVPRKDRALRLCGDYKVSLNEALIVDQYPLPKHSDLSICLTSGTRSTKLDLFAAYRQLLLKEKSQKLTTINKHKGLFRCTDFLLA